MKFKIGYSKNQLLLKYYVVEESIQATASEIKGDVYKDSCVKFFISTDTSGEYYNFEFNCIGTPMVAYGKSRHDRVLVNHEKLKLIKTKSSLGNKPFDEQIGKYR